jgi:CheY-like chemotaxis protein
MSSIWGEHPIDRPIYTASLTLMELLARDSLRIVHVENYDDFAIIIQSSLNRAGFEQPIVRCNDGVLALHYFSMIEPELAPHVILLDLHMPNMDGLEVLHWLRHEHSEQDVAVYLLTSSDDPEDRRQAAAEGVTEYILKNSLFDKLIQKLDDLIAETNRHCVGDAGRRHDVRADISPPAFVELSLAPANA